MEDQERIEQTEDEDVEAHKRGKKTSATDEPTDELGEMDDVEAHRPRKQTS